MLFQANTSHVVSTFWSQRDVNVPVRGLHTVPNPVHENDVTG